MALVPSFFVIFHRIEKGSISLISHMRRHQTIRCVKNLLFLSSTRPKSHFPNFVIASCIKEQSISSFFSFFLVVVINTFVHCMSRLTNSRFFCRHCLVFLLKFGLFPAFHHLPLAFVVVAMVKYDHSLYHALVPNSPLLRHCLTGILLEAPPLAG